MDVAHVRLNKRNRNRCNRVAQRIAVVRQGARIENHTIIPFPGLVNLINQCSS